MTSFRIDTLFADAVAACNGLHDFGDPSFRPALKRLCAALDAEGKLGEVGRAIFRQKLVGQLSNRLRIEDYFRRYPEIASEPVAAPVVIVGLPRTGTTKLHRLLSRDPRFYWMAFWESQFPVPFSDETIALPTSRLREARALVDMMTTAMPKLLAIHPLEAEEADEEVMLMEHSFLSAFNAYANIPGYVHWLDEQDQAPAYAYLRRALRFLQWQKRQRGVSASRWVLKSPHHLLRMATLLEVFPGVRVIQTHRDPVQSIPSTASFIHTLWCIYSDQADPAMAGQSWSRIMQRALNHTMRVRERSSAQFFDVQFRDTVERPMEVVQCIYRWLEWDLPQPTEQAMRSWLAQDEKTHQGGHDYTAEQFGLSESGLQRDFVDYRKRYVVA